VSSADKRKEVNMLFLLLVAGIILFVLWMLGLLTRRTLGGLVHLALVIAIILIIIWLIVAIFKPF
jgi:FtsH-binding integral membrane protein